MGFLFRNFKNIVGWKTQRKLVVFAVDDYGNVRVHSKTARLKMNQAGLPIKSRFDAFDALETRQDLEELFDVLSSVKDSKNKHAVFSAFALSANINFEEMARQGNHNYVFELLPDTYAKLAADDNLSYNDAWRLWKEGISKGLLAPEFHGREHINLKLFHEKLLRRDHDLITALQNRSFTSIDQGMSNVKYTAAFAYANEAEIRTFPEILETGLNAFEKVFGYRSKIFTPPAHQFPYQLESSLPRLGIESIDRPFYGSDHAANGKLRKRVRVMRRGGKGKLNTIVRNVVFEPTQGGNADWVAYSLKEIEAAFRWNRPAVISSHRVNYCGHIDERNRAQGLCALRTLLKHIVTRWPDIEFISVRSLSDIISNNK